MKLTWLLLLYLGVSGENNDDILCSNDVCKSVTCDELPDRCKIQNSTHNGIFFLSPLTCNCCQYCLENLNEGEACTVGDPANSAPTTICGPGLFCKLNAKDQFDGKCSRINTLCTQKQDEYDQRRMNGSLGSMELKQTCDDDGLFSTYKCIPGQTCYCVHKNGSRIFGESDYTSLPDVNMKCKCSRDYYNAVELIGRELNPAEHFRCTKNGDYDPLQCFGDKCLCVDSSDGAPTYPNEPLVNITKISKTTLQCYQNNLEGIYYKKCEEEYVNILNEMNLYKKNHEYEMILSYEFPKCDLDGTYKAVQENATHKMCVDKEGNELTVIEKSDALAEEMDCKCIRALSVMSTYEKPNCEKNGNYAKIQCRRGRCRCVDSNGNQVCDGENCEVDAIDIDKLHQKCS